MSLIQQTDRFGFGLFELDLQAGELWKGSHKIRLAGQPIRVLATLLARPGEVVTREEMQRQIWGANTTVDFERALAGAVNKVREALGDSADNPRFIQTLPKRGYRFIAPVALIASPLKHDVPGPAIPDRALPGPVSTLGILPAIQPGEAASRDATLVSRASLSQAEAVAERATPPVARRSFARSGWMVSPYVLMGLVALLAGVSSLALWLWFDRWDAAPLRVEQLTHSGAISAGPPNVESLLTLATDGNRILTSVMREGRPRLSAISLSTGEVEPLSLPQELVSSWLADISRDGSRLLLKSQLSSASEQPLWIVPSTGGSAQRVGTIVAHDASWTPDGRSVLFAKDNDLSLIRLDTGATTPFAHLRGRAFWIRWSPDGKLLRFTLMDPVSHLTGIWELPAEGGTPRRVPAPPSERGVACCGTWTADGSAYVMQVSEDLWQLKEGVRGATLTQLTNGPVHFLSPVAAPSGSRIYFRGLNQAPGMQIYKADAGFQPAPTFLADAERIDFSRDGVWVAWTDHEERLWRARAADGSDKVQLTPGYLEVYMGHWSPDGKRLAIMAREHGKAWKIGLVDAAGGKPEPLLSEERNEADPGWSGDGKSLVFGREPDLMGKESGSHSIGLINLETSKVETVPGSEGLFSPRWSPDGRWIVALSLNQKSLVLYDVAQKHWTVLAERSAADPCWSADSRSIYVQAFLEEHQPILRVDVPSGETHVIADLSGFHDAATVNYFFGGVTRASEPMVQPRVGTGDLYTLELRGR